MNNTHPIQQFTLEFTPPSPGEETSKASDLSAIVVTDGGDTLWVGSDEWTSIDRFTKMDDSTYGDHTSFELVEYLKEFNPDLGEIDIEGIAHDNSHLWLIGSHSSKRKKVKLEDDGIPVNVVTKKALKEVTKDSNRYLLARIPLVGKELIDVKSETPTSAFLERGETTNALMEDLAIDEYIGPIIRSNLPSKDNGFDIEGLAVKGNSLWIGLRGPVLRGIAIVLQVEIIESPPGKLQLQAIGATGKRYRKHFLDLEGLGVRDLCFDGDDLLVLAGPTMTLDGDFYLFRLTNPLSLGENSLSSQINGQLNKVIQIPHGLQCDRAEGIALFPGNSKSILTVYDSPSETKNGTIGRKSENRILIDRFEI
jgi:hypothetical protein